MRLEHVTECGDRSAEPAAPAVICWRSFGDPCLATTPLDRTEMATLLGAEPDVSHARPAQRPRKFYVLDMFPYPSGDGLHVGHPEGYTATDIVCRFHRMRGTTVMHPMGWDAFGLPAEQHAKKTGTHPRTTTEKNIANFRRQLKMLGFTYDWDRELATTDVGLLPLDAVHLPGAVRHLVRRSRSSAAGRSPSCRSPTDVADEGEEAVDRYRDEHRLAYQLEAPVNWCPALGTVLANEEVHRRRERARRASGRPHPAAAVDAADHRLRRPAGKGPRRARLVREHQALAAELDRPQHRARRSISSSARIADDDGKPSQKEFEGWLVDRTIAGWPRKPDDEVLRIYTTRPDTLFGATYMVIAPEHPFVERLTTPEQAAAVRAYCEQAARKSDLDRTDLAKEKTGVFTGSYAINPVNGEAIPIWVADYVLISYGTGRDHGRAGPRHPRLRVRQAVRPADRRGGRSGRRGRRRPRRRAGRAAWPSSPTARRSTPAPTTACPRPSSSRRSPKTWPPRASAARRSTTSSAIGSSAGSISGASRSRSCTSWTPRASRPAGIRALQPERPAAGPAGEDDLRRQARRARRRRWTRPRTIGST